MEEKILNRFDNLLKETLKDKSLNESFSFEEEGTIIDINSYIAVAKGFSKIAYEESVKSSRNYNCNTNSNTNHILRSYTF